jgi:hypothetical protein
MTSSLMNTIHLLSLWGTKAYAGLRFFGEILVISIIVI